jgi:hypothetical protein
MTTHEFALSDLAARLTGTDDRITPHKTTGPTPS